jgi:hypothetical protein
LQTLPVRASGLVERPTTVSGALLTPTPLSVSCCCAVVFAPTLFFIRGSKGQQMLKEVEMQVTTASTLKIMLQNHEILWDVRCVLALFKEDQEALV